MAGSTILAAAGKFVVASVLAGIALPALAVVQLVLPPQWAELPPPKQQILAPLSAEWNQMEAKRRKKWLEIADRYPQMGREEQERVQRRMRAWAKLTPEERMAARQKYQTVKKASPEQRDALRRMWSEYQTLPDDEKQRLKESAAAKTNLPKATPKPGAGHAADKAAPVTRPSLVPAIKQSAIPIQPDSSVKPPIPAPPATVPSVSP